MSTFGRPQLSPPSSLPTLSGDTKGNHAQTGHLTASKAQAVVTEPDEAAHATQVFHYQRESSEIELFYDLFLVGTIATVSINNEIVNAQTFKAYLGFFTLLWTTWLHTVLYDVRFSKDSLFHQAHKIVSCGTLLALGASAALYDTGNIGRTKAGLKAMSLVLMTSRLALVIPHGIVLWTSWGYKKVRSALILMLGTYLLTAAGYLAIALRVEHDPGCYVFWYVICGVETASIIAVSCYWTLVSFRPTHLVERLGELTLVIIGEGILVLSRRTYQLFGMLNSPSADVYIAIICAALLTYLVYALYFNHINHDEFGSIRQQVWILLHYPLHLAILLTLDGSSFLIMSGTLSKMTRAWLDDYPLYSFATWDEFFRSFSTTSAVVSTLTARVDRLWTRMYRDPLVALRLFNYTETVTSIEHIPAAFNSSEWQQQAIQTIGDLWTDVEVAIYHGFGIEPHVSFGQLPSDYNEANAVEDVVGTAFLYFYFAAGSLLMVLAIMCFFAKKQSLQAMWLRISIKVAIGLCVILPVVTLWLSTKASWTFFQSPWTIATTMLGYFLVVGMEMFIDWLDQRKQRQPLGSTSATLHVPALGSPALFTRQTQTVDLENTRSSPTETKSPTLRVSIERSVGGQVEETQRT